jgi:hypothetical protein
MLMKTFALIKDLYNDFMVKSLFSLFFYRAKQTRIYVHEDVEANITYAMHINCY